MNRLAIVLLLLPLLACEITCEGDEGLDDLTPAESPALAAPADPPPTPVRAVQAPPEPVAAPAPDPEPVVEAPQAPPEEAEPVEATRAPVDLTPQDRLRLVPETMRSRFID